MINHSHNNNHQLNIHQSSRSRYNYKRATNNKSNKLNMPTNSDPTNSAACVATIEIIKELLIGRWPKLVALFTEENIFSALSKVVKPETLDSNGNYTGSARLLQTSSYDYKLRVDIKADLFLIQEEIVRAATTSAAATSAANVN